MNAHLTLSVRPEVPRCQKGILHNAFTLVELLVVIAIIGVLASLVMPALAKAKSKAKNIACVSQLRQLGVSVRMYADDHQNRLPSAELLPSLPANANSPQPRICDVLRSYAGGLSGSTNNLPVFQPYDADAERIDDQFVMRGENDGRALGMNIPEIFEDAL